jgi:hypothetical protein
MHFGFFIGYTNKGKIVFSFKKEMQEEFMQRLRIDDPQNVIQLPVCDLAYAKQYSDALEKLIYEDCGPQLMLRKTLNQYLASLPDFRASTLPQIPARLHILPNGKRCCDCGRTLPEEDGFGGVTTEDKLRCFSCYNIFKGW